MSDMGQSEGGTMSMELRRFLFVATFLITCAGLALAQEQTTTPPDKTKSEVDKAVDKTQTEADKAKTEVDKTTTEVADKAKDVVGDKDKTEVGKVRVRVSPEEAYIFVDGKPYRHRSTTLVLPPGEHTITVYNYGYEPMTQKVQVSAGTNPEIEARLKPSGEPVSGPWGRIQIEGAPGDAPVFLNGDRQPFFVGHVDEMNNNFKNKQ